MLRRPSCMMDATRLVWMNSVLIKQSSELHVSAMIASSQRASPLQVQTSLQSWVSVPWTGLHQGMKCMWIVVVVLPFFMCITFLSLIVFQAHHFIHSCTTTVFMFYSHMKASPYVWSCLLETRVPILHCQKRNVEYCRCKLLPDLHPTGAMWWIPLIHRVDIFFTYELYEPDEWQQPCVTLWHCDLFIL